MIRIKNFVTWLLGGSAMTSGDRNIQIAAHGAKFAPDGGFSWKTRHVTPEPFNMTSPDGGTVYTEHAGITETPEERSRRLKRERDRRYKAKKKAKTTVGLVDAYA